MPNQTPIATEDAITVTESTNTTSIAIATLLANDTDPDNDSVSLLSIPTTSSWGAAIQIVGTNIVYTPTSWITALGAGVVDTDSFTYIVADPSNTQATGTVTLTATGINNTPAVNTAAQNQPLYRAVLFEYDLPDDALSDVDLDDTVTITAKQTNGSALPSWLVFDSASFYFSGTPPVDTQTALSVIITATDTANTTASTSFTITPTNTAPLSVTPIESRTISEQNRFSLTFSENTFYDPDTAAGDVITYTATRADGSSLPTWLTLNSTTRTFSGKVPAGAAGELNLILTATDTSQSTATSEFTLFITNLNDPPTLANKLGTLTWSALEYNEFTLPENTFIDVDEGDSLTLTAKSSFKKSLPAWLSFDGATLTGTPPNESAGLNNVLITATDSAGAEAGGFLKIKVSYTNQTPILNTVIPDQSTTEGARFSFAIPKKTFTDPDKGDTLTLSASGLPDWLFFQPKKQLFTGYPDAHAGGEYTITVLATDQKGLSLETSFLITVADNPLIVGSSDGDWLDGDEGDNLIYGKKGNDTLEGGEGSDTFVFDTSPSIRNLDILRDFIVGVDKIGLSTKIYPWNPEISTLEIASVASSPDTRLLFNPNDHTLSYDPDGSGSRSPSYICILTGISEISADDISLM